MSLVVSAYERISRRDGAQYPRFHDHFSSPAMMSALKSTIASTSRICAHQRGLLARVFQLFLQGFPFHGAGSRIGWGALRFRFAALLGRFVLQPHELHPPTVRTRALEPV